MKVRVPLRSIPGIAGDGLNPMIQTGTRDASAEGEEVCDHGHMVILILVVSVIVVAALSISLGRWLQRKGTAMERHGDDGPPGP